MKLKLLNFFKIYFIQTIKIVLGVMIAYSIADYMNLKFATSTIVIAAFSILPTRKETFLLSLKRLLSFFMTMIFAFTIFHLFDRTIFSFSLFMFFLVAFSYLFNWESSISVNAVIGTHFLLLEEVFNYAFILNEFLLVCVGISVAMLMNVYMPKEVNKITGIIETLELQIKEILYLYSDYLVDDHKEKLDNISLEPIVNQIKSGAELAYKNKDNLLKRHSDYYIQYFEARKRQYDLLIQMQHSLYEIKILPKQSTVVSQYLSYIADTFHERNPATDLINEVDKLLVDMKKEILPKDRDEFQNRAVLYYLLIQIKSFLMVKKMFVLNLSEEQLNIYWYNHS